MNINTVVDPLICCPVTGTQLCPPMILSKLPRRQLFRVCPHCNEANKGCVLDELNGPYSVFCEDSIMAASALPKDERATYCRHAAYIYMATLLGPMFIGERRKLPACVVRDIQETFPCRDSYARLVENEVEVHRPYTGRNLLLCFIPKVSMEYRTSYLASV